MNFMGQPCAKLNMDQPIYEDAAAHYSFLIAILSPLLFFAPYSHLTEFEKVWVDQKLSVINWKPLVSRLADEWKEFILYSAVMCGSYFATTEPTS
jgi:hypothetical protein